ncbi:hypothetical protein HBH64_160300 [Parastagonospora nodorum]|nr:hypothetical protein HBI10_147630 [Parastagonospora nodorum]KAH4019999.1 hypothetical protein HBI13_120780 [Parastagonospora nodorum]KAH4628098.1 hypothetical protein HBH81_174920 [Parastagonospora nodorum]KAH4743114.1 hypothetical protein HBH64_160300 [Parastagonospora nodorum]KAH5281597.1 hypothetical protein HBI71_002550 [Parastagonospora nodorum]
MAKTSQYDKRWLDTVQSGTALDLLFSVCPQSFETKYECLLTGHIWDIGWDGNARNQVKRVFGLLGVCRQISVEAMTYPWSSSTFCVVDPQHIACLRFRVTMEINETEFMRNYKIYRKSTAMNKYYRLLTDISGEMRRIHPGKMTYNINTDGEHIRRLFQK